MSVNESLKEFFNEKSLENLANALWEQDFDDIKVNAELQAILENKKNSEESYGRRMKGRIKELIDNPESFNPNYKTYYESLLKYTDSLTPQQAYAMTLLLGLDSVRGYQEIQNPANIKLPNDDAPQFNHQVGWHFFVGSCWDASGKEYGIQFMFWQYTLLPPALAKKYGLNTLENQILELHLAISRAGENHYRSKPVIVGGTSGLIGFEGHPYRYSLGKNYIKSMDMIDMFPLEIKAWGVDKGFEDHVELEINLFLERKKDYILQGAKGCAPCCGGVGTLYYSVPNLKLNPKWSKIRIGDEEIDLSRGKFWYDHQWGTGFLPGGSPRIPVLRAANNLAEPSIPGWDWFMAQFDGEHELTFYALHSPEKKDYYFQSGVSPPGILEVNLTGKYVAPDSQYKEVKGILRIDQWVKSEKSPDPDVYPLTHTWYPDRWHFSFGDDVPSFIQNFTMMPIVEKGQSGFFANGMQYSEGAVFIKNPEGKMIGRGFAESVSYADTSSTIHKLAGIPPNDEILNLELPGPSKILKLKSYLYLRLPANKKRLKEVLPPCIDDSIDSINEIEEI
jgi:predicted secreted hydrolase